MAWGTLGDIKRENERAEADASRTAPTACPNCGNVLQRNRRGVLNCPTGDYRIGG